MNYFEYIQQILGDKIDLYAEEQQDYNLEKDSAILSRFTGNIFKSCVTHNYQLQVFTNNIPETMEYLFNMAFLHNDNIIETDEYLYVKNLIGVPINNSNFQNANNGYIGSIVVNLTAICSISVVDIKTVEYKRSLDEYGCFIDPTRISFSYSTEIDNQRASGENLNKSDVSRANLTMTITIPNENNKLCSDVEEVMFGNADINRDFIFIITKTNGISRTITMKLQSNSLSSEKSAIPLHTLTFIK